MKHKTVFFPRFINRYPALAAGFVLMILLPVAIISVGAQQDTQQSAPRQNRQASPAPVTKRKLAPIKTTDEAQGSRLTITSDGVLSEYSSYRSADRFYVVIPSAESASAQGGMRGRGFEDLKVQRDGNDTVLSFRLQPGATARVERGFNKLAVVINTDEKSSGSQSASTENGSSTVEKVWGATKEFPAAISVDEQVAQVQPAPAPESPSETVVARAHAMPLPTPTPNPAQQDATRPPGTEQNQTVPPQARPVSPNPTAPPGVDRPAAQAPPGTNVPIAPATPETQGPLPSQNQGVPLTAQPGAPVIPGAPISGPTLDFTASSLSSKPIPVPPLPSLTRLGVTAQTLTMTLNEAIRRALQNNSDIEVARDDVRFAETTLHALEGFYDPVFSVTPQIDYRVTPQGSRFGGADTSGTTSTTNLSLNPSVNKFFQTGGGQYNFFFNNNRQTTTSLASLFTPQYSANLGVTITQPLLRDRSIDRNRHDIRVQKKHIEQSDADFRRKTMDVISQVQSAYWELVFALRDQQVQIDNVNLTRENFRRTEAQIAAGAAAPLTRAEVQTELSTREAALLVSSQNVSISENNLKQLIFRDPTTNEWSAPLMPTDEPSLNPAPVSLSDALTEARANRPELQRLRLQGDINKIDVQFFKNQAKPRIDLQATVSSTGLAGTPLPQTSPVQTTLIPTDATTSQTAFLLQQLNLLRNTPPFALGDIVNPPITVTSSGPPSQLIGGYGQMLSNLLNLKTRNVTVGVAFQIPFRNKTAQANLAGAIIQREQLDASIRSQEQAIEVDVRNAAQSVETARQRILTAQAERQSAEVLLSGEQKLYQVGRSTTFLLFQRENALANARDTEVRAEVDYNKALSLLQHATSTTLRANNVIVQARTP